MSLFEDQSNRLNARGEEEDDVYTDSEEEYEEEDDFASGDLYISNAYQTVLDSQMVYNLRRYWKMGYHYGGKVSWVFFTSAVTVAFPLLYAVMKLQSSEQQKRGPSGSGMYDSSMM